MVDEHRSEIVASSKWEDNLKCFYVFVDCASRYISAIKTNLMQYLTSVYFLSQPLHVSGMFVARHQEFYCMYIYIYVYIYMYICIKQLVRVVLRRGLFKIT